MDNVFIILRIGIDTSMKVHRKKAYRRATNKVIAQKRPDFVITPSFEKMDRKISLGCRVHADGIWRQRGLSFVTVSAICEPSAIWSVEVAELLRESKDFPASKIVLHTAADLRARRRDVDGRLIQGQMLTFMTHRRR